MWYKHSCVCRRIHGSRLRQDTPASALEIARNMNVPEGTVLARAKREGWTQQIAAAKQAVVTPQSNAITPMQSAAITMAERGEKHAAMLVSLRTRWQPLQDSEPLDFDAFLRAYCSGFLVLQPGSRFAGWLGYREPDRASRYGIELRLDAVARAPWPMPMDALASMLVRSVDLEFRFVVMMMTPLAALDPYNAVPEANIQNAGVSSAAVQT